MSARTCPQERSSSGPTGLPCSLVLHGAVETEALARALAPHLRAGDTLALRGEIGAGKSVFARALIKARLNALGLDEDVPSPTFTLVQTYVAGDLEIWHSDLYRLANPDEAHELGLEDAFATALCLIEWPERLGGDLPAAALTLDFAPAERDDQRRLTLAGAGDWPSRLAPILDHWRPDDD